MEEYFKPFQTRAARVLSDINIPRTSPSGLFIHDKTLLLVYILNSKYKIRPLTKDLRTLDSINRSVQPYLDCCSLVWGNC